jgi:hypothetical protein
LCGLDVYGVGPAEVLSDLVAFEIEVFESLGEFLGGSVRFAE